MWRRVGIAVVSIGALVGAAWVVEILKLRQSTVATVGTMALVLVTGWYVWLTRRLAVATERTAEGQLLISLLSRYSEEEMAQALREVENWANSFPADYAHRWSAALTTSADAQRVDKARRIITHYFLTVARLHAAGHLSEQAYRVAACEQTGINVMFPHVYALERALVDDKDPPNDDLLIQLRRDCLGN